MAAVHSPSITPPTAAATSFPALSALSEFKFEQLSGSTIASSALVLVVTLLLLEQSVWRYRKGKLPGWKWQIVRARISH